MKKILLSFVLLLGGVLFANAQGEVDIDISNWGWSYHATPEYSKGVMTITLTADYGQGATGWGEPYPNWSQYSKLVVVIDSYNGDWGEIAVCTPNLKDGSDWDYIKAGLVTFGNINTQTYIEVPLDVAKSTQIRSIYIKGASSGTIIKVSRVFLVKNAEYATEGKNITLTDGKKILASEFANLHSQAKIVFTYNATGDLQSQSGDDWVSNVGWGIGQLISLNSWDDTSTTTTTDEDKIAGPEFKVKALGEISETFSLGALKPLLDAKASAYDGNKGIIWNMYDQGKTKPERVSVTAYSPVISVTIGEYGWATFCSEYALDFTGSEVKAYTISGHTGNAITKAPETGVTIVKANTPLLLNAPAGTYKIPVVADGTAYNDNKLKAGDGSAISKEDGKTKYVLGVTGGKAEFQKINATAATVPTGKAYLEFDEVIEARSLDFDDEGTTAIKNMKVGENDNIYYDLQGRRVLYPKNGLYIVNGKKVIVK